MADYENVFILLRIVSPIRTAKQDGLAS